MTEGIVVPGSLIEDYFTRCQTLSRESGNSRRKKFPILGAQGTLTIMTYPVETCQPKHEETCWLCRTGEPDPPEAMWWTPPDDDRDVTRGPEYPTHAEDCG